MRTVELPVTPPFAVAEALTILTVHALPGQDAVDAATGTVRRWLRLPDDTAVPIEVRLATDRIRLVQPVGRHEGDVQRLVRRWLDLDADPAAQLRAWGHDPLLGPLAEHRPGVRVVGYLDVFECAATTVLGQQVSVAAGRTFTTRLLDRCGQALPSGGRIFPTAPAVAAVPVDELRAALGVTGARARTLSSLAAAVAHGLVLDPDGDLTATRRELLALPGIGPWTLDLIAMRGLADRDAFPAGDLVVRRAMGVPDERAARTVAARWSPHRAAAAFQLWAHALAQRAGGSAAVAPDGTARSD
ncbi:DNA-3-methyladenine glycosylase family protein [Nakamurella leprariae]|uniref:DNA-3-methyladenine glycosylase II n=1 Tax=Nakamurella leprariae TaxID=2803911 RepID=A0A938YE63_9ACTN|nr:DNA-3-methyladenine glycosylase 2 family protein [Nakamurella leprariae]MBM9467923.1 DNA-3-methyladenine glycosylase 2 family protein [Nakamurella leprariae]